MSKIKVSQKLSLIGKTKKQIACVKGLGLRRINDSRIVEDTPENLGMINTVRHMVEVEQLGEQKNAK
jgi:large subunit ribosomal protein L30|tara:strand:+ start:154 stop:354 length:201 start_codon:yes stop_codon:yes gene_type:complete